MTRPALLNIRLVGLDEIQRKLGFDALLTPEFKLALESFEKRFKRGGKGVGAKRNTLSSEIKPLSVEVETTLHYPRMKGSSWGDKNWKIAKGMSPRVLRKMIKRIKERWAA